jgi:hypothetical protein
MPSRHTHKSPAELFTSVSHEKYDHLQRSHVWGSPIYVLQPELQDAKKIGKWQPRARRGMFLGVSPEHSSNVVLTLNLNTGYVSPQFHTVHDDLFSTVSSEWDSTKFDPHHWQSLLQSVRERYGDPSINPPPLANEWLSPAEQATQEHRRLFHRRHHEASRHREFPSPPVPPSLGGGVPQPMNLLPSQNPTQAGPHQVGPPHNQQLPTPVPLPPMLPSPTLDLEQDPNPSPTQDMSEESDSPVARITRTRSGRQIRPPSRKNYT